MPFDLSWLADWQLKGGIFCLLLLLEVGGGCGKSQSSPPPAASSPASNSTSTPTVAVPTAVPTAEPVATPTATPPTGPPPMGDPSSFAKSGLTQLQLLNRALLGWEMKNHRRPQTFEEFASMVNFQIPNPPAGQKYAFDQKGFIILVNPTQ